MSKSYFPVAVCLVLFLFVVICFSSGTAKAASDRCSRHSVEANLVAKLAKTKVYKGTTENFTGYVTGHSRRSSQILGFVDQGEIYTRMKYEFSLSEAGEGSYCVNLDSVDGYFYAAPKLYLPTDYKKNSCEYEQIKKHEKRHLQVVYDFHKKNTGKYASYLGRIARSVPIFPPVTSEADAEKVKQSIAEYFEQKFREQEAKSMDELKRLQAKVDSPSEYMGVAKRCSNW